MVVERLGWGSKEWLCFGSCVYIWVKNGKMDGALGGVWVLGRMVSGVIRCYERTLMDILKFCLKLSCCKR